MVILGCVKIKQNLISKKTHNLTRSKSIHMTSTIYEKDLKREYTKDYENTDVVVGHPIPAE